MVPNTCKSHWTRVSGSVSYWVGINGKPYKLGSDFHIIIASCRWAPAASNHELVRELQDVQPWSNWQRRLQIRGTTIPWHKALRMALASQKSVGHPWTLGYFSDSLPCPYQGSSQWRLPDSAHWMEIQHEPMAGLKETSTIQYVFLGQIVLHKILRSMSIFQTRVVSGVSMSMIISFPDAYRLNSHHVLHLKYPIHTIDVLFLLIRRSPI
jgi:hypothetical protein